MCSCFIFENFNLVFGYMKGSVPILGILRGKEGGHLVGIFQKGLYAEAAAEVAGDTMSSFHK